ncbi:MAG TPA: M20/M25/M40 family metallo-hydrolase [Bacillota bacterium]|nr:M20/M25/M40 family metallo-hydrolase [Bacillota bacterium]
MEIRNEAVKMLTDLIRINTVNPPGNEVEAARYVKEILEREGIESTIHEATPGRANFVARIPGTGRLKPLVLLSHLDVVGANPSQWQYDPFGGIVADDYIWGRGALDMKGMLTMELLALLQIKRSGKQPHRDVILVAAADEEAGGECGISWLLEQGIPGLKEAEYVINEGGEGITQDGRPIYSCQNGEKGVFWINLTVTGTPGHGSMPVEDNAIFHMNQVLNRIGSMKPELSLSATTRSYITAIATAKGITLPPDPEARDQRLKQLITQELKDERSLQAMFYHTISPTIMKAGMKTNVLPEKCELTLDCRLLPGETPESFLQKLRDRIDDPQVTIDIIHAAPPTESPVDTELFGVMERTVHRENPKALVVPYLSPGGTDSRYFRRLGITAYGFMPILISEEELRRMHGIDERLSLANLEQGTRILAQVVREICGVES